jgi:hypothetical protein
MTMTVTMTIRVDSFHFYYDRYIPQGPSRGPIGPRQSSIPLDRQKARQTNREKKN